MESTVGRGESSLDKRFATSSVLFRIVIEYGDGWLSDIISSRVLTDSVSGSRSFMGSKSKATLGKVYMLVKITAVVAVRTNSLYPGTLLNQIVRLIGFSDIFCFKVSKISSEKCIKIFKNDAVKINFRASSKIFLFVSKNLFNKDLFKETESIRISDNKKSDTLKPSELFDIRQKYWGKIQSIFFMILISCAFETQAQTLIKR